MKSLAVNELMQYGQQLYDRGDYSGASAVFYHVLDLNAQQPQALQYLKKMGQEAPEPHPAAVPVVPVARKAGPVDLSSIQAIQKAIDQKDEVLNQLQQHETQLESNQLPALSTVTGNDTLQDISQQLHILRESLERNRQDMRQLQEQLH